MHSPEGHDVITAELVACSLGQRSRPELRVDWHPGGLARAISRVGRTIADGWSLSMAEFRAGLRAGLAVRDPKPFKITDPS
jgi:hypothetical protein